VLVFITFCVLTSFVVAADVRDNSVVTSLNFGVVVKRLASVDIATDFWNEAYIISLPKPAVAQEQFEHIDCSQMTNRANRSTCLRLRPMVHYLYNISSRAVTHIHTLVRQIRSLVLDHIPARRDREKKSFLPFGGSILHGLFGVARDSDINHVTHAISEIRRQNVEAMSAWKDVSGRLASLAKTSNNRMDILHNMIETQKGTVDALLAEVAQESVEMSKTASLLTSALSRFEDYVMLLDNLERLQAGVEGLIQGFLSPALVPPNEIEHSLYLVGNMIRRYRADLRILRNGATFYYGQHHFVASRHEDHLVVNLHIPLTDVPISLPLYQVHILPVPVPGAAHATVLHNVPPFFAYHAAYPFHLRFDERPNLHASNMIYLHEHGGKMQTNENLACILAILNDRQSDVKRFCQFTLLTHFVRPDIFVIDESHIVLTNISNVTLRCYAKAPKVVNCQMMCKLSLPCRCSLHSSVAYMPQHFSNCISFRREPQMLHAVNLALLQQFFSESKLDEVSGDTLLPDRLNVLIPSLKIYQAEYSHELNADRHAKFDLSQISNLTKQDRDAYSSLAHTMVDDWHNYKFRSFENDFTFWSWKSWLPPITGLLAAAALVGCILLMYKVRSLSMTVTLLSMTNKVHALPVELNYFTTTYTPKALLNMQSSFAAEKAYDLILMFLVFLCLVTLIFRWYYKRTDYKFDLYLYVGRGNHYCKIWVRSFPLHPSLYTFSATKYIDELTVSGCIVPRLCLNWQTLRIYSQATNENYFLPKIISLTWKQKLQLNWIFAKPFWCLLATDYQGHIALLELPSRNWDDAPVYGETSRLNHAISLVTLSPSAPNIYPQLSSIDDVAHESV